VTRLFVCQCFKPNIDAVVVVQKNFVRVHSFFFAFVTEVKICISGTVSGHFPDLDLALVTDPPHVQYTSPVFVSSQYGVLVDQ
jgi:hypothetical protein